MCWLVNITAFLIVMAAVAVIYVPRLRDASGLLGLMRAAGGVSPDLLFVMLTMMIALMWFGPLSYVRVACWCAVALLAVWRGPHRFPLCLAVYVPYLLWLVIGLAYTDAPWQGVKVICRYAAPVLFVWLGYRAVASFGQVQWLFRRVWWVPLLLSFFFGGFAWAISVDWFDYACRHCCGLFVGYGFLADYVAVTVFVPLTLFAVTRKPWWALVTVLYFMQTVFNVVRTGIGALFVGMFIYAVVSLRRRAAAIVCAGLVLAAVVVFTQMPEVRQKMFVHYDGPTKELLNTDEPLFKQIRPTLRDIAWNRGLRDHYDKSPAIGSGTGSVVYSFKTDYWPMHNDYMVMLCENGIVGVVLYGCFALVFVGSTAVMTWRRRADCAVRLSGAMAAGSMGAALFCMGFDNAVSYLLQCYIFPFLFYGFFLKFVDIYDAKNKNNITKIS